MTSQDPLRARAEQIADVNDRASGEAAYCHHRHHLDEHSTNFNTCPHPICVNARQLASLTAAHERLNGLIEKWRDVTSYADARFGGCTSRKEIDIVKHVHRRCSDELESALTLDGGASQA